jgi:hypothetical protein
MVLYKCSFKQNEVALWEECVGAKGWTWIYKPIIILLSYEKSQQFLIGRWNNCWIWVIKWNTMTITFNLFFIYGNSIFSFQINITFCVYVFWFWNKKVKGIEQVSWRCNMNYNWHKTERSGQKNTRHWNCGICFYWICFSYLHIIISFVLYPHHYTIISCYQCSSMLLNISLNQWGTYAKPFNNYT